jgi:hypothetical protein
MQGTLSAWTFTNRCATLPPSRDAVSFSIHFPIKGAFKSAKCRRSRSHNESQIADRNRDTRVDSVLTPASGAPAHGEFAPADALDKLDTLTAPWKCATLKGTLGRFVVKATAFPIGRGSWGMPHE